MKRRSADRHAKLVGKCQITVSADSVARNMMREHFLKLAAPSAVYSIRSCLLSTVSLDCALEQPQTKKHKVDTNEAGIATEGALADIDDEGLVEATVFSDCASGHWQEEDRSCSSWCCWETWC
jgi:hypothetical protein